MTEVLQDGLVRIEAEDDGAIWRVVLNAPKANIIDTPMCEVLTEVFGRASEEQGLKAVILEGEGKHFSFGASVQEHLPERVGDMLPTFHRVFSAILAAPVFSIAAIRGQCLGGGLELASICHRIVAAPDAKLGQPEIVLGVIAPVASVVLPQRCGSAAAADLCVSGRSVDVDEALRIGLVDAVHDDPGAAALDWAREYLLPRSAASLRYAVRALRFDSTERILAAIAKTEQLYLQDLMATSDAKEGIAAFLEKRTPQWRNS